MSASSSSSAEAAVCLQDIEEAAHKILPLNALDYYRSGADQQLSLRDNKAAFQRSILFCPDKMCRIQDLFSFRYRLLPRVLLDVSRRDLSTRVLGGLHKISMPVGISPTAMQRMAHPLGELAAAKAAQKAETVFIMSTLSTSSIEEVAEAAPNAIKWFQLYIYKDRKANNSPRWKKKGFL
jgi:(S)-2-hydroxy-acid oxidase